LDSPASPPIPITEAMFPKTCNQVTGCTLTGAGWYTYNLAKNAYSQSFLLREPRKTFRFTVATTF
jgi:outer membrane protein insertion porin family